MTNTTTKFTSWDYDYSDRSYNLTLEGGDTMTVTYGDEYVTMKQGDTITNIYYLIQGDGSGGGGGGESGHVHNYVRQVVSEALCWATGLVRFLCEEDNVSYEESTPALGHIWEKVEPETGETAEETTIRKAPSRGGASVQPMTVDPGTVVDVIETGVTVYKCLRCLKEYISEDGSEPPT